MNPDATQTLFNQYSAAVEMLAKRMLGEPFTFTGFRTESGRKCWRLQTTIGAMLSTSAQRNSKETGRTAPQQ